MNISIREFVCSLLLGAKSLDSNLPHLKMEAHLWESWSFDDFGAHYITLTERKGSLIHDRAEEKFYQIGRWPQ